MKNIELIKNNILNFDNQKVDYNIIDSREIKQIVSYLIESINNNIEGDVVELGCYVGESSKYLMKTLLETKSSKKLYLYDSFDGLPDLSECEFNCGWTPGTLKTTQDILENNFIKNNLPLPIISKGWFNEIQINKLPNKISFAFLDGDFYKSIYDSLVKIYDLVTDGGYIVFHDYDRPDLPGVKKAIFDFFDERGEIFHIEKLMDNLGIIQKNKKIELLDFDSIKTPITIVTGLWDIKRDELSDGWSRPFNEHYIERFKELLKIPYNLIIFGDEILQKIVFEYRSIENTQFILKDLSWFKNNEYFDKIQLIRNNPEWSNQVGWLSESTQSKLEYYNPLVMSKMFLLHDAKILDKFDSEYLFWIDAGITNTVHPGYFTHDKVIDKLPKYVNNFHFICFPYETSSEIHGFKYDGILKYSDTNIVNKVARGGFFGGKKSEIGQINNLYYSLLIETLGEGYMGTEESLFTIMSYKHPELISYSLIDDNGLVSKFFEDLKNETVEILNEKPINTTDNLDTSKVSLYVIGFNSPNQLKTLIQSMNDYDRDFLDKPKKYLLNNSTDRSTDSDYQQLCNEFGFEIIWPGDNLGICGGRQYIAEHFDTTNSDYYLFFEDDMFFYNGKEQVCRNGFNRYIKNLYSKTIDIVKKENFDFIKFNFTEFYGDNSVQWSWYNVPQVVREQFWPNYSKLPQMGTDPNAPKTKYDNIKIHDGLPYVSGEIYYCNWPQLVSRTGNKKMFLDTKWAHPFEQTWMSYMFQETKKGNLSPGILLATPTEHNRFEHYAAGLRKES